MTSREKIIESILYIRGDQGIKDEDLMQLFSLENKAPAKDMMNKFIESFNNSFRGTMIETYNEYIKWLPFQKLRNLFLN